MTMEANGLRDAGRKRVLMNATIIDSIGNQQARVSDLTHSGVRIVCSRPIAVDSDVIFKRGEMFAAGRIVWADKAAAGIEFYRLLTVSDSVSILHPGASSPK